MAKRDIFTVAKIILMKLFPFSLQLLSSGISIQGLLICPKSPQPIFEVTSRLMHKTEASSDFSVYQSHRGRSPKLLVYTGQIEYVSILSMRQMNTDK